MPRSNVVFCETPSIDWAQSQSGLGTVAGYKASNGRVNHPAVSLDAAAIRKQFEHLCAKLKRGEANIVVVKHLTAEVLPSLLAMESLLSPSLEHKKDVLQDAGVPSWSAFLREFCTRVNHSLPEIRNLLREHRGLTRISPINKSIDRHAREMLTRLLDVLEANGERLPLLVTDVCRTIQRVLSGQAGIRAWRGWQERLDRLRALHG